MPHSDLWEKPVGWAEEWLYILSFPATQPPTHPPGHPTGWILGPVGKICGLGRTPTQQEPNPNPTQTHLNSSVALQTQLVSTLNWIQSGMMQL